MPDFSFIKKNALSLVILTGVFMFAAFYTFNEKLDLNGDNSSYYIFAKSLATGKGYSNLASPGSPATNTFPPGYPLIMVPLMWITDSVTAQNFLGELFMLASLFTVLYFLTKATKDRFFALFVSLMLALNFYLLQFAGMMMSELPYAFLTMLVLYGLYALRDDGAWYKSRHYLVLAGAAILAYHVRTQGIVVLLAILIHFLCRKEWRRAVITTLVFAAGLLPWIIRNQLMHLSGSRYISQVLISNQWDPEKGTVSLADFVSRTFTHAWEIVSRALPASLFNFLGTDYSLEGQSYPVTGVICMAVILFGCWQLKKIRFFLLAFILGNIGIISIWSARSGNRYLICFLPILFIAFYYGVYRIIEWVRNHKFKFNTAYLWGAMSLVLGVIQFRNLALLHEFNKDDYPASYQSFFDMSEWIRDNMPDTAVYCTRKPELFYMFSKRQAVNYLYSNDPAKVVNALADDKVDYVVLDQFEYSSTATFLAPAIEKYRSHFAIVNYIGEPRVYLLRFDKQKIPPEAAK